MNSRRFCAIVLSLFISCPGWGAIEFNNSDNNVINNSFSWPTGGPITISLWVKTPGGGASPGAFSVGNQDSPHRCQSHMPWSDNNLYWDYGDHNVDGRVFVDFTAYLNKWTHVALVSQGNGGTFKAIYINGVLANSGTVSDGPDVALTGNSIGSAANTYYHKGMIDDFRIYNRVLSANEIRTLASPIRFPCSRDDGCVGYWRLDDGLADTNVTSNSTRDSSGYGNTMDKTQTPIRRSSILSYP